MQLVTRDARVEVLAAIDEVRRIEETPDIKLCNDQAGSFWDARRERDRPKTCKVCGISERRAGHRRTGIDDAHPAFGDGEACGRHTPAIAIPPVAKMWTINGTHVCGSAVGDGAFDTTTPVTDTAPGARLVIKPRNYPPQKS